MLHVVTSVINAIKDIFHPVDKWLLLLRSASKTMIMIGDDSSADLVKDIATKHGFFNKAIHGIKNGVNAVLDVTSSPSFGRVMVVTSAVIVLTFSPIGAIAATAFCASTIAAVGIGVGIGVRAHMRLRDAQLEHAILNKLKQLHDIGDREKGILELAKDGKSFSGEKALQARKVSAALSYFKTFQNRFAESIVGITTAILSGNIPFLFVTSISAVISYQQSAEIMVNKDKALLALKSESDKISNELGLNTSSKGRDRVNQLLELYNESITRNTEAHAGLKDLTDIQPVSILQAVKDAVIKGFSATEASHLTNPNAKFNPYEKEQMIKDNIQGKSELIPQALIESEQALDNVIKPEIKHVARAEISKKEQETSISY